MIAASYAVDEIALMVGCSAETVREYHQRGLLRALSDDEERYSRLAVGRLRLVETLRSLGVPVDLIKRAFASDAATAGVRARCLGDGIGEVSEHLATLAAQAENRHDHDTVMRVVECQRRLSKAYDELASCSTCTRSSEECDLCGALGLIDWTTRLVLVNE